MNSRHVHHDQTKSWYLLGGLFKISDDHPRHFYMGVPPPPGDVIISSILLIQVCKRSGTFQWFVDMVFPIKKFASNSYLSPSILIKSVMKLRLQFVFSSFFRAIKCLYSKFRRSGPFSFFIILVPLSLSLLKKTVLDAVFGWLVG